MRGHAGTGKTYLACRIIEKFLDDGKTVTVLCPTHQAKYQFSAKLEQNKRLEIDTVASFLTQFPIVDKATGELVFQRGGYGGCDSDLLVIDETSMVSEYEMSELLIAKEFVLVIFLGDFEQLRPVMKKQGDLYKQLKTFTLTQQQRNAGPILEMCSELRERLFYPVKSVVKDNGSIIVHHTREQLIEKFLEDLQKEKVKYNLCYLAYRNATVEQVRIKAHRLLYGSASFTKGQYLRLDGRSHAGNNGSILKVLKVEASEKVKIAGLLVRLFTLKIRNLDLKQAFHVDMVGPKTQIKLKNLLQDLYNQSAKWFRKNHIKWKICQEEIKEIRQVVMYSCPYVSTVHKSQGRSIPRVYVDTLDINSGNDRKRLMYVGCSRAIDKVHTVRVPDKSKKKR